MRRKLLSIVYACTCLLCCRMVLADGAILNGVSAHTIGRGGTNIAHTDNGSILHDNPAAMGMMPGHSLTQIGTTVLISDFHYADPENNNRGQHQAYGLPEFAHIRKRCSSPWTFGFGGFGPAGFGSIYNLDGPPSLPGPQRYKSYGSLMKVLAGAAYSPHDRLSVGATLGVGYGMANLEGPYTLQGPNALAGTPMILDLETDGVAFVWSLGVMYQLTDKTTLGLAYQSESDISATGRTHALVPSFGNATTTYDTKVDITWPRSLGLGVRHELPGCQVISADVIWFNWADAFDDFGITLTRSSNIAFPDIYEEYPLDWRDTVSVRLGYEKHLGCGRTMRLGYTYHRVPVPASTITPYIPVPLEHAVSAGYSWPFKGWLASVGYMYTFGPRVRVGNHGWVGGDFDQSVHRAQTHAAGITFMKQI